MKIVIFAIKCKEETLLTLYLVRSNVLVSTNIWRVINLLNFINQIEKNYVSHVGLTFAGILNVSSIFYRFYLFWYVRRNFTFEKTDHRICIKFCLKSLFEMLIVVIGKSSIVGISFGSFQVMVFGFFEHETCNSKGGSKRHPHIAQEFLKSTMIQHFLKLS